MMSERNFSVQQLPGEQPDQTLSISRLRNYRNTNDTSRAQLVSSDVNREPRRPSMSLEPSSRDYDTRSRNVRRGSLQVTQERRYSNVLGESIQQTGDNSRTDVNRDRRISNGHVARYNHIARDGHAAQDTNAARDVHAIDTSNTQMTRETSDNLRRYSENSQSIHYHHRPVTEPRTLRDLPPVDVISSRRREFQGVSSARTRGSSTYDDLQDKDDRYVVPALPMPVAIICCVLNFIIPGFGSMTASLCIFCCAKSDDMTCGEKLGSCCTVFGIGVLQLLLVACFLIGWVWSCIWGITFIGMSATYYHDDDYIDDYYTESNNPAYRGRVRGRTPLPTPQVVEDQPYPGIRYEDIQRRQRRREAQRHTRSRISLTPSNLIYPMRAPSNIAYNSPPPPYQSSRSPPPAYQNNANRPHGRQRQNDEPIEEEVLR